MDITPLIPKGRQTITGYGNGGFKVNNQFVAGSLLLFPDHSQPWDEKDFNAILAAEGIEFLVIGTGKTVMPLAPETRQAFKAKHIFVEVMDTGAACRTYNVLMSEERRVAAALVAV